MLLPEIISEFQRNKLTFENLLGELSNEIIRWRASAKRWCLLEIVCHLLDEEVEDFRARTKHALESPELPLKSINPVGWLQERNYLEQNFEETLKKFLFERQVSIEWLKSLENPNWENAIENADLGKISAKSFLFNWLAHDYHHIRQINAIKRDYLKFTSGDDLAYAGNW
ncbi:DinB family protein [Allomuricauda sp. d1]|uniref:DinB family protein n=1 Tax=Allomuricauda sp. d1 TaxID=3136725 RepID=UPI0031D813E5